MDRDSRTAIGKNRHMSSPIWSSIEWLAGPKARIFGLSFPEFEFVISKYNCQSNDGSLIMGAMDFQ